MIVWFFLNVNVLMVCEEDFQLFHMTNEKILPTTVQLHVCRFLQCLQSWSNRKRRELQYYLVSCARMNLIPHEAMKSSIRYANKRQWFGLRNPILTCWDFFSDLIYRLKFFYQRRKGKKKNQIIQRHEHKFLLLAKLWSKLFVTLMTCANLATSTGCHSAKLMVYWAMTQSYILAVMQYMSHAQPNSFTGKCEI